MLRTMSVSLSEISITETRRMRPVLPGAFTVPVMVPPRVGRKGIPLSAGDLRNTQDQNANKGQHPFSKFVHDRAEHHKSVFSSHGFAQREI
jgi:hypothetical protein